MGPNIHDPLPGAQKHSCHTNASLQQRGRLDADFDDLSRQFTNQDLVNARVINQVDRKFIACLIDDHSDTDGKDDRLNEQEMARSCTGRSLILVDQHAADERVRVEQFLKELCLGFLHSRDIGGDPTKSVQVKQILPPLPVLLTRHEAMRLADSEEVQKAFYHWGFHFADLQKGSGCHAVDEARRDITAGYTQVWVQSIPEVVSEKVRS